MYIRINIIKSNALFKNGYRKLYKFKGKYSYIQSLKYEIFDIFI